MSQPSPSKQNLQSLSGVDYLGFSDKNCAVLKISSTVHYHATQNRPGEKQRQTPRLATVAEWRGQIHLRHHAAEQLRRGVAICAGADLDAVSPHPRRAGKPRGRGSRGDAAAFQI